MQRLCHSKDLVVTVTVRIASYSAAMLYMILIVFIPFFPLNGIPFELYYVL